MTTLELLLEKQNNPLFFAVAMVLIAPLVRLLRRRV